MDTLEQRYRALLARIERYPVSDPTMRARELIQIEAVYRDELQAALSPEAGTVPSDGGDDS